MIKPLTALHNVLILIVSLILVGTFVAGMLWWDGSDDPSGEDRQINGTDQTTEQTGEPQKTGAGEKGWSYPIPAAKPAPEVGSNPATDERLHDSKSPLPKQPHLRGPRNPQVASVIEAGRTGGHPERRTALMTPKPFDPVAWENDPQAYLDVCEPGRVFQPAQPGQGVKQLGVKGSPNIEVASGASTELAVKAIPEAPVTFTSFDLGNFSNQLTSITVKADDKGIATATFFAVGTVNDCNILAASPLCSGQINFTVFIPPPEPTQEPDDQTESTANYGNTAN